MRVYGRCSVGPVRLRVRVIPRARHEGLAGERDGALLVRVTAPPVEGRANDAVCRVIARALGVAPGRVEVVRGHSAREKMLAIDGVEEDAARRALGLK
jgi:uncharacterized protein (TIGR00251 family)